VRLVLSDPFICADSSAGAQHRRYEAVFVTSQSE